MLRVLDKLNALIRESPDIQTHFEVADSHDEIVIWTPPCIGKTSDAFIYFALPIFFSQTLNMYQRAPSNGD
jgi:hypothetical protein